MRNGIRIKSADISANLDGSLIFESTERTQDLFDRIGSMSSDNNNLTEDLQLAANEKPNQPENELVETEEKTEKDSENLASDSAPEIPEPAQDSSTPEPQLESELPPESAESVGLEQLQKLDTDKQKLTQLGSQLEKVEVRIENARRTNIFGRPQSGENERERDKLVREIQEVRSRMAENEALIQDMEAE